MRFDDVTKFVVCMDSENHEVYKKTSCGIWIKHTAVKIGGRWYNGYHYQHLHSYEVESIFYSSQSSIIGKRFVWENIPDKIKFAWQ